MLLQRSLLCFSLTWKQQLHGEPLMQSPPIRAGRQLGAHRPAWAAAWVEAALSGGLASLPPPVPGARVTPPNGVPRTGVAPSSSPALAARSLLSGGGRHGTRRAGAVVTTPAPPLLQARAEGQSPARRREATGAGPAGDEGQPDKGDRGRASMLAEAGEAGEGSAAQEWQQGSSTRATYPAAPAEHTGEALSATGNRPEDGGSCPEAVGPALEAWVREGAERQLVALVERVLEEAGGSPLGTGGRRSGGAATELLTLLHRAHKQLAEVEAASADYAMRAKAATARDEIVKHVTAYVSS
ncbi:hypothetical protein KFL_008620050 [Klebsormidium nitens]|uniref:Uncharacterized protein n=1 Tax=Klebsormidium nitens TaxID=105231 RepID=A0A1Y1ILT5_KLENI|nr:hypothetical protein KFL_008620050 [Klebsormidium nitens]|eukprot:GAQ91820.1 hypothetical protein KFL_008620050 [Klebsormidium nitens]